jgi:hypothetical protein
MIFEGVPSILVLLPVVALIWGLLAYTYRTHAAKERARDNRVIRRMERDLRDSD